jgi:hypothetical protein
MNGKHSFNRTNTLEISYYTTGMYTLLQKLMKKDFLLPAIEEVGSPMAVAF